MVKAIPGQEALIWLILNDNIMFSWQAGITRLLLAGI